MRHAHAQIFALALSCCALASAARAATALHCLWELHGKHNTVYLLGSIHVLRAADYPLAPALLDAYAKAQSLVMEIDLQDADPKQITAEMLASATLPTDETLPNLLGTQRYTHAAALARDSGVELAAFDRFAPWFAAEAISQVQLTKLGFQAQSGVEMYFLERARDDHKSVAGLETVHDEIALFEAMPMNTQADFLVASLHAWQRGDTAWFVRQFALEWGPDPAFYRAVITDRNRKWVPRIEALLRDDKNYLVIVGTGHLVGHDSVIELLEKDGIGATQR